MSDSKTEPAVNPTVNTLYAQNLLLERKLWLSRLLDPRRDIDKECGHPDVLTVEDFSRLYRRGDIATRIVSIWPEESWSERPQIYEVEEPEETDFEKAWFELEKKHALLPVLTRADVLSGIGRFGIVLLGLDDGLSLDKEVAKGKRELLYVRVFDESCVTIAELEADPKNPRYGLPKMYQVLFRDTAIGIQTTPQTQKSVNVHWSRVLHIADNRMSSDIYGQPRLEMVANRVLDLSKIAGGSGEMFWKGGFPGVSLEALPEVLNSGTVELDKEATKNQIEAYQNGLQRYLALVGMKANSLSVQVADPTPHVDVQIKLIAAALGVPWRILIGSEAAQLASEQDTRSWNRRLTRRRNDYVTPYIIMPFLRRLIDLQVLPTPKDINVAWPDLNTPSDADKAKVAEGLTNAITKYVMSGSDQFMPPYHFLTLVCGLTDEEATAVVVKSELQLSKVLPGGNPNNNPGRSDRLPATRPPNPVPSANPPKLLPAKA